MSVLIAALLLYANLLSKKSDFQELFAFNSTVGLSHFASSSPLLIRRGIVVVKQCETL